MCELISRENYVDNITRKVVVEVLRGSVSSFWHIYEGFIEENCHDGNATTCTIF